MASSTKSYFQKGKAASSKLSASAGGSGATKKSGNAGTLGGSETTGVGRANNIQVIHNGKIVTPVSLHARPKATANPAKQLTSEPSVTVAVAAVAADDSGVEEEKADKPGTLGKPSANARRYVRRLIAIDVPFLFLKLSLTLSLTYQFRIKTLLLSTVAWS